MFTTANFEVKELIPASAFGSDYIDWGLKEVGAEIAWQKTKGKGIKIAILDTGVDSDHRDLHGNIKGIADFTGSAYGAEDAKGHGTHCAGIIAGLLNGMGMVGVAPEVELYCGKVLGDSGSGSYESIYKGLRWAIDLGVDIISMSLGSGSRPPEAIHMLIQEAHNKGIIMFAATGNENSAVCWPAMYDEVIAVSAIDEREQRASFSNYGMKNEITAPGVNIISTYLNGSYARLSGTSMATPLVAGSAALIIARYLEMHNAKPTAVETHRILINMVKDLGNTGKDELYGFGMINLALLP